MSCCEAASVSPVLTPTLASTPPILVELLPVAKKRGRKPKGGKIVSNPPPIPGTTGVKSSVILQLKCFLRELVEVNTNTSSSVEPHSFIPDRTAAAVDREDSGRGEGGVDKGGVGGTRAPVDELKELNKKLKHLEIALHTNSVDSNSACFWDTCEFDTPPIYIPTMCLNGIIYVYGCFCSRECAIAHLMKEHIDTSVKFERLQLFNSTYCMYDDNSEVKPAPDPHYMLDKFYGNLTIPQYRSLFRHDRAFLIINKPLTKLMPELHENNNSFVLNSTVIPTNRFKRPAPPTVKITIDVFGG